VKNSRKPIQVNETDRIRYDKYENKISINRINYECFYSRRKQIKTTTIIKESKENNEKNINKFIQSNKFSNPINIYD